MTGKHVIKGKNSFIRVFEQGDILKMTEKLKYENVLKH